VLRKDAVADGMKILQLNMKNGFVALALLAGASLIWAVSSHLAKPPVDPEAEGGIIANPDGSLDFILVYATLKKNKLRYRWRLRVPPSHLYGTRTSNLGGEFPPEDVSAAFEKSGNLRPSFDSDIPVQWLHIDFEWPPLGPEKDRTKEFLEGKPRPNWLPLHLSNFPGLAMWHTERDIHTRECLFTGRQEFELEVVVGNPNSKSRMPCDSSADRPVKRLIKRIDGKAVIDINCLGNSCAVSTAYHRWPVEYIFGAELLSQWQDIDTAIKSWLDAQTIQINERKAVQGEETW
jgi:hypothetical protein